MKARNRASNIVVIVLGLVCLWPGLASAAQDTVAVASVAEAGPPDSVQWLPYVAPNSEDETYLRYLQIAGGAAAYPWGLRGFSPSETRKLAARVGTHPWSRTAPSRTNTRRTVRLLPLSAELRGNSSFPYGSNDGPVWAGRGLTASATIGFMAEVGPVSLVLAPTAFIAQNLDFDLVHNGQTGDLRFADALYPLTVDRPQRFGADAYGRVDPGNSTLRAELGPVTAGVSTANLAWGPSELYPYTLGTNAPGFVHGFVGTSRPVNLWIASLHARAIWGRLYQSEYSSVQGSETYVTPLDPGRRRFASGLLALVQPRGMPGLELGIARFYHSPWPESGIPASYYRKPFENILKNRLKGSPNFPEDPGTTEDNQEISGFVRWAFPRAGLELYAEYGREDHAWDKRDLLQEPDHSRAYGLGMRKTFRLRPDRMDGVTFELINFQLPHLVRTGRGEGGIYTHGVMRQGHTNRGQLLGAGVGVGEAAGSTIRWDAYKPGGRTTLALQRTVRAERSNYYLSGIADPRGSDVQYSLSAERLRRFRRLELTLGLALIHELNRNFREDVTAASAHVGTRIPLGR